MDKRIPEMFQYTRPEVPKDCIHAISPSQIDKFFQYPSVWYNDNLTDNTPSFKGNTSSVIGTICHYVYKCVSEGIKVDRDSINEQLTEYLTIEPNEDVDITQVMSIYPQVVNKVVNEYVLPHDKMGDKVICETPIVGKVMDGIYVSGTFDRLEGDILCDYKNVSVKPNEHIIPFGYKVQLLSYAYALRQHGYDINHIRIIYGVRPTKTIPARCIVVTETITEEYEQLIKDTLELIGESVLTAKAHPELIYLLFKSMKLKNE